MVTVCGQHRKALFRIYFYMPVCASMDDPVPVMCHPQLMIEANKVAMEESSVAPHTQ